MYLSDQIFVDIPFSQGNYLNYTLNFCKPNWDGLNIPNATIFGRVYSYSKTQKLYLNDLLSSYADNYSWMSYDNISELNKTKSNTTYTQLIQPISNAFTHVVYNIGDSTGGVDVELWYNNKGNEVKSFNFDYFSSANPDGFNLLTSRTKVLPRIPKLDFQKTDFFIGAAVAVNKGWVDYTSSENNPLFRVIALDKDKNLITPADDNMMRITQEIPEPVFSVLLDGYLAAGISPGQLDNTNFKYLAIAPVHKVDNEIQYDDISHNIIIAEYDDCVADYYLIWCDRTGGYQCQPFSKKAIHSEDITTTMITNLYDEDRPYQRSVKSKWVLNSDWLNYDQYRAYESIFTAPYTYLFDTKHNELIPVICSDKTWTEKTNKNDKKPFNLKITVTENRQQNIIY